MPEQRKSLLIGVCRGDESNLQSHDLCDLVEVDLGEDYLFGDSEGIIPAAIELRIDSLEVADSWQGYCYESFKEFVHSFLS